MARPTPGYLLGMSSKGSSPPVGALVFLAAALTLLVATGGASAQPAHEREVPVLGIVAQGEAPQQPEQTPGAEDPVPLSPWLWAGLVAFALIGAAVAVTIMRRNRPRAGPR
jgi:hypothetical protein